ncbi:MAG TPA: PDZ domain-containing protein [Polyangia bacterium]
MVAAALLLVGASACGPAPGPIVGPEPPPLPPPTSAPASAPTRRGEITRAELNAFLDRGMPAFIHDVVVDRYPRRRAARFRGWRIVEFFPGDARFAGAGIQPGDVVVRVNGRPIERPDQFVQLWSAMRRAAELTVELERAGTPRQLRWRIVD